MADVEKAGGRVGGPESYSHLPGGPSSSGRLDVDAAEVHAGEEDELCDHT